jgi:serine/threonine protein kinase
MALSAGVRIGSYEIVSILGIGGMGEVYRARDLKLGRDVALKVLPTSLAGDPERFSRFQREARVLASVSHPHIAVIYGVEESGGVPALVMELVDGHTLADRIAQDPPSVLEACTLAMQIAEAVEAAHDAGIIHRDLKPANIKVRGDGTVKVLDFGFGKSLGPTNGHAGAGETATDAPYGLAQHPTQPGLVLGTPAYMAPEQARGRPVDKRADIWAFGCLFYELLTGRRLFGGATASDTLAAVLTRDIDLDRVPAPLPPRVRQLLARCLDRDPRTRLRDIGEARVALQGLEACITATTAWRRNDGSKRPVVSLLLLVYGLPRRGSVRYPTGNAPRWNDGPVAPQPQRHPVINAIDLCRVFQIDFSVGTAISGAPLTENAGRTAKRLLHSVLLHRPEELRYGKPSFSTSPWCAKVGRGLTRPRGNRS